MMQVKNRIIDNMIQAFRVNNSVARAELCRHRVGSESESNDFCVTKAIVRKTKMGRMRKKMKNRHPYFSFYLHRDVTCRHVPLRTLLSHDRRACTAVRLYSSNV